MPLYKIKYALPSKHGVHFEYVTILRADRDFVVPDVFFAGESPDARIRKVTEVEERVERMSKKKCEGNKGSYHGGKCYWFEDIRKVIPYKVVERQ